MRLLELRKKNKDEATGLSVRLRCRLHTDREDDGRKTKREQIGVRCDQDYSTRTQSKIVKDECSRPGSFSFVRPECNPLFPGPNTGVRFCRDGTSSLGGCLFWSWYDA